MVIGAKPKTAINDIDAGILSAAICAAAYIVIDAVRDVLDSEDKRLDSLSSTIALLETFAGAAGDGFNGADLTSSDLDLHATTNGVLDFDTIDPPLAETMHLVENMLSSARSVLERQSKLPRSNLRTHCQQDARQGPSASAATVRSRGPSAPPDRQQHDRLEAAGAERPSCRRSCRIRKATARAGRQASLPPVWAGRMGASPNNPRVYTLLSADGKRRRRARSRRQSPRLATTEQGRASNKARVRGPLDRLGDPLDGVAVGLLHAPDWRRGAIPPRSPGRHFRALGGVRLLALEAERVAQERLAHR